MAEPNQTESGLEAVAFVGEALAPFFLRDPKKGTAAPSFAAMAALDAEAAAAEWPFVAESEARACLERMQEGLRGGVDDDLMWEYRRLFVGPGRKACPPWGSVYTDRECVMFGISTLDLRQWMRERGVERLGGANDPEDHIGLLLELAAWLARNKPACLDEFLRLHLLTWAPHFLELMERETRHPFYEGLARLTRLSLEGMRDARGLAVDVPRFYR
ncbi:MAG TPA: Tat proofreading chaperone DmsD [Candidatus Aphodovivens avistercoris]|nr:Tat proofreading chaperone DmsD [Candidatus Aphodovivens avistercoris]